MNKYEQRLTGLAKTDGRYRDQLAMCIPFLSEGALIKFRLLTEIEWLSTLNQLFNFCEPGKIESIRQVDMKTFAIRVCEIEKKTNHDVKAVEMAIAEICTAIGISVAIPYVHMGLTSNDINSIAYSMMLWSYVDNLLVPQLTKILKDIEQKSVDWKNIVMLGTTHGQWATPVTLGLSFRVFWERFKNQIEAMNRIRRSTKFGSTVGGWNSMRVAYSDIDWPTIATCFCTSLGFERNKHTTQIDHYDNYAELFDAIGRIINVLVDMCWDVHSLMQKEYLKLTIVKGEVGSSTQTHKVNPIQFENAIGNLTSAISSLHFLSEKLPVSREQRDLTDSTKLRDLGEILSKVMLGLFSVSKGLERLNYANEEKINEDLNNHWEVLGEPVQTVLRKVGNPDGYKIVAAATRTGKPMSKSAYLDLVNSLNIPEVDAQRLRNLTPVTYGPYLDY
jgi:adenylosuccinate lyase